MLSPELTGQQSNPYALKDASGAADMSAWTSAGLQPTTGYYPYDPALAAYGTFFPFLFNSSMIFQLFTLTDATCAISYPQLKPHANFCSYTG
ncbi:hypothetical protein NQ317_015614 [Molorchus minor]|uniref:Uncharacterized protein n=1 Tax=Molorchus minor TaxID=1323400 RepID=A0ABQ9JFK4_9CUCU|nr:hypothetical protein NQ317_015614 [Molorchus minor]